MYLSFSRSLLLDVHNHSGRFILDRGQSSPAVAYVCFRRIIIIHSQFLVQQGYVAMVRATWRVVSSPSLFYGPDNDDVKVVGFLWNGNKNSASEKFLHV
jgi:hypothetical protein